MPRFKVLITDYAWPDVEIERRTLAEVEAELIVAEKNQQDAAGLAALAKEHQVQAIMTNWAKVTQQVIEASPKCGIVSRLGIGLDNIDVAFCTSRKIPVTNVPDYCLIEVAEHASALLLSLARKVAFYHHATKSGRYELQAGPKLRRIEGQTLGIVGLGNIGCKLAHKAIGLGMRVIAADVRGTSPLPEVKLVSLEELLAQSDYVSLHVPLIPATRHLIGAAQLAQMKPSAYLINTARGGLIDHGALAAALKAGNLAGAALDVQESEPPDLSQPPYNDERVIVTPHAAFASEESLVNLRSRVARQVATRLTGGVPENVVNGVL
jgi:D-3-phosphoglycerate dehydrogenase